MTPRASPVPSVVRKREFSAVGTVLPKSLCGGGGVPFSHPSTLPWGVRFLSFFKILLVWRARFLFFLGTGLARTGTNTGTPRVGAA